jgi:hypothetical protein
MVKKIMIILLFALSLIFVNYSFANNLVMELYGIGIETGGAFSSEQNSFNFRIEGYYGKFSIFSYYGTIRSGFRTGDNALLGNIAGGFGLLFIFIESGFILNIPTKGSRPTCVGMNLGLNFTIPLIQDRCLHFLLLSFGGNFYFKIYPNDFYFFLGCRYSFGRR